MEKVIDTKKNINMREVKHLHEGNFSNFTLELQDLVNKYVEGGWVSWSSEDGWAEFTVSMPQLEEEMYE